MLFYRYALLCRDEEILSWTCDVDPRWLRLAGHYAGEAMIKHAEHQLRNGLAPAVIAMVEKLKELGAWEEPEVG